MGTETWGLPCGLVITVLHIVLKRAAGQDHMGVPGRRAMAPELGIQV